VLESQALLPGVLLCQQKTRSCLDVSFLLSVLNNSTYTHKAMNLDLGTAAIMHPITTLTLRLTKEEQNSPAEFTFK
jgi:hypothetical protein